MTGGDLAGAVGNAIEETVVNADQLTAASESDVGFDAIGPDGKGKLVGGRRLLGVLLAITAVRNDQHVSLDPRNECAGA